MKLRRSDDWLQLDPFRILTYVWMAGILILTILERW